MKVRNQERIIYQKQSHIVVRRFEYKGEKKVELLNPSNNVQFVVNASDLK